MYDLIKKMTSPLSIIIGCILSTVLMVSVVKGFDIKTIGTGLYPTYASVYEILQQFTAEAKGQYKLLLALDSLFALAHGATCAFLIVVLFDKGMLKENLARKLVFLPMGNMVLDWAENFISFVILVVHPTEFFAAYIIGTVTFTKWMIVCLSYLAITGGLVGFVVFFIKSKMGRAK
ncbi:hypothetical protein ACFL43_04790 [Thermodesulfobacteriota bacterium]